jgi:hypothetical protein
VHWSVDAATLLRGIVLAVIAANVGAMVSVARRYAQSYRRAPACARLLPLHVVLVTVSTLGLQATLAWALMEAMSTGAAASPGTLIRTGLYALWSIGIFAALVAIARVQQQRLDAAAAGES